MERLCRNNIILIGFMGSGKTSVGRALAKGMEYHFLDTDVLIEQEEQQTIPTIFENKGEAYFRNRETQLLYDLLMSLEATVVSTGGGIPLREQNRDLLRKLGFVVFLKASDDTIIRRLRDDTSRPLLVGEALEHKVVQLQREREPVYTAAAHSILKVDELSPIQLAHKIIEAYELFRTENQAKT